MVLKILTVWLLVAVTVVMHAAGFTALLRALFKSHALASFGFWSSTWLLINLTGWLILVHLAEIAIWGLFYFWQGCLPDVESALYFSGVTYTTVGYGDLVLARPWRMFAPIEALTGILMCGVSSSAFFAVVIRRIDNWMNAIGSSELKPP
jgi:Ion channel